MSSAPEIPVRPGDVLAGKYRVERVLGHGGMGVVVAATQLDLGRLVALKFLLHTIAQTDVVARFLREARIVGGLRSEHVTRVYELGQLDNGVHYMAMEYLDGADLAALLVQHGRFHFSEAAAVVRQACEAIAEAHRNGVVHRDLKPANLFSTRRPNGAPLIKVLDFGISKSSAASAADHSMTRTSALMGSPYYMSPEQMARPKTVDFRTDIWSLGVILHELVTGKVPFQGETLAELALNVHHEEPPPIAELNPDVPALYQAIVTRCLQKDRELRYGSIRELSDALAACEASFSLSASATNAAPEATSARAAFEAAATGVAQPEVVSEPGKTGNSSVTIAGSRRPGVLVAVIGSAIGVAFVGSAGALLLHRSASPAPGEVDLATAAAAPQIPIPLPQSVSDATPNALAPSASSSSAPVSSAPAASVTSSPVVVPATSASGVLREPAPARRVRAKETSPRASADAQSSSSGAPRNQHPRGWDDDILKP